MKYNSTVIKLTRFGDLFDEVILRVAKKDL